MSEFTYIGPSSALFIAKNKTKSLVTGQTYSDLDENHPQVKNLIAHKLLVKKAGNKHKSSSEEKETGDKGTKK